MKSNLRKFLWIMGIFLSGAVVGGGIAGYGTAYYLSRFVQYGTTLSQRVAIRNKVMTLNRLRQGKTTEAINHLEMMLDGDLIYFSVGIDGSTTEQKEIREALKVAKEYRKQYPRKTKYPDTDKVVAAVLAEADK